MMDSKELDELLRNIKANTTNETLKLSGDLKGNTEAVVQIAQALENNTSIKTLLFANNAIDIKGRLAIARMIMKNRSLTMLDLSDTGLGNEGALVLAIALENNSTLTSIDLHSNGIDDDHPLLLAAFDNSNLTSMLIHEETIKKPTSSTEKHHLKDDSKQNAETKMSSDSAQFTRLQSKLNATRVLSVSSSPWKFVDLSLLEKMLETNTSVNCLIIDEKHTIFDIFRLAQMLIKNKTIQTIVFCSEQNPYDAQMIALSVVLTVNQSLRSVTLSGGIDILQSLTSLTAAMEFNRSVVELQFESAGLDITSCVPIANMLKRNNTLKILTLRNENLGDGIVTIAAALENASLRRLSLFESTITNPSVIALANALKKNLTLNTLILNRIDFSQIDATPIAQALKENRSLTELSISFAQLQSDAITALGVSLLSNTTLTSLDISGNYVDDLHTTITDEAVQALCEVLLENRTLKTLDLAASQINSMQLVAIAGALKINRTLTSLGLERHVFIWTDLLNIYDALKHNRTITTIKLDRRDDDVDELDLDEAQFCFVNDRIDEIQDCLALNEDKIKQEARLTFMLGLCNIKDKLNTSGLRHLSENTLFHKEVIPLIFQFEGLFAADQTRAIPRDIKMLTEEVKIRKDNESMSVSQASAGAGSAASGSSAGSAATGDSSADSATSGSSAGSASSGSSASVAVDSDAGIQMTAEVRKAMSLA